MCCWSSVKDDKSERMNSSPHITIIGTGPAGLGAADKCLELQLQYSILESKTQAFGHCKSFALKSLPEVYFDEGPHISFTKKELVQEVFKKSAGEPHLLQPKMMNFWKGLKISHPPQSHLYQVPQIHHASLQKDICDRPPLSTVNYYDWLVSQFGQTFTDLFPEVYTKKYWTVSATQMTTDWIGERIHRPTEKDMLSTLAGPQDAAQGHYFTHFRYPKAGGFESFLKKSLQKSQESLKLKCEVRAIHTRQKQIQLSDSTTNNFEFIVSSMPLNRISRVLDEVPQEIALASQKLCVTSVTLYSFVFRSDQSNETHWMYVYDPEIPFARLYFPKALVQDHQARLQAVQVEVYSSPYRSREKSHDDYASVVRGLEKMQLLREKDIVDSDTRQISHANVLFDHHREPARSEVLKYLESKNIFSVGRFGDWAYLWSDESYLQGQQAVEKIVQKFKMTKK